LAFRYRKSVKLAPGVRMTVSKSGVGYSVGGKGYRVTKRADGRIQQTASLPGTGIGYTSSVNSSKRSRRSQRGGGAGPSVRLEAQRRARAAVPMPRRMKIQRYLVFISVALTLVGFVVLPLLLLGLPCLLVGLVMSLVNLRTDLRWWREYKAAQTQALADLLGPATH
jgi:hypothetical protein